eukprot:GDKK01072637.1.p1 GENE.GDKK01072637.1~~GDKK01072637.1.p1  ORF type:complete len:212 (+),score=31.68 GDKK01072637.1:1-636(+)
MGVLDGDIDDIRFAELNEMKRVYADFILTSGSMVAKKHHRFDTLERQVRLAQLQKDTANASLDPHVTQHESELVELSNLLLETEAAIISLEGQQASIEDIVADPLVLLEDQCKIRGLQFVHPAAASTEKVVADRRAFVDRTQQFVNDEFDVVAKRKEQLQRLRSANELEQEQHAATAASISRTHKGQVAAGSPLSSQKIEYRTPERHAADE